MKKNDTTPAFVAIQGNHVKISTKEGFSAGQPAGLVFTVNRKERIE